MIKRRNFPGKVLRRSNWADHSCQLTKLFGERHCIGAVDGELALANHVYQFGAGEHGASGPERFEVEHWPGHSLDGAMILLDDVVEVFTLAHQDWYVAPGVDRIDRRLVGAALVHRDLARIAVRSHGLVEEALRRGHVALRRQQEVDGLALLVDSAVEILPDALDFDVCLIHAPATADRALVFPGHLLHERQETNRPPVDRRMVDRYAALFHHLLEVPVTQRVGRIPTDADQDDIDGKAHPFEIEHIDSSWVRVPQFTRLARRPSLMRQNL